MGKSLTFLKKISVTQAAFFFCCMVLAGMLTTNFFRILPSLGLAGLLLTTLFSLTRGNTFADIWRFKYFAGFILLYLVLLLGFVHTEIANPKQLFRDLELKLPLIIVPVAFAVLPAISRKGLCQIFWFFLVCVFLGSVFSVGYYLTHFDAVNAMYSRSKVMPTPTNHVRFSLMVAFSVLIAWRFWLREVYVFGNWERKILLGMAIWLFVFLHVLAVRSGLLAFYAAAFSGLAFDFLFRRQYLRSFFTGLVLLMSLLAAFYTLPTFYNKFYLTLNDVNRVSDESSAHDYSITGRVYSYKVAMDVFRENPVIGVGMGNLYEALGEKYRSRFPEILERGYLLPHNQFLFWLAAFGVVGFLISVAGYYYPLLRFAGRFEPLFVMHYLIVTISCLFETTFETQVGLLFSIMFVLLPLWYYKAQPQEDETWQNGSFFGPKNLK